MMVLKHDDIGMYYVWVDAENEEKEYSTHFDHEEDAQDWYDIYVTCARQQG